MAITVQPPYNPNRPTNPRDPNGIAHATSNNTKEDRKAAKIAWADYVQNYKIAQQIGDSSGPSQFPIGTVVYPND